MTQISYTQLSEEAMKQLSKNGAFLTSKYNEEINTMTISWASLGTIWAKPIMTIAVRYSRHSYNLIDNANQFTVSIPEFGQLKEQLAFCGSKSGRDYNKFEKCGFKAKKAKEVETPIIDKCSIHFECKIIYKQAMEPGLIDESIKKTYYSANNDYHVLYYGEIVACYKD